MGEMWLAGRTARMCVACGKQEGESRVINGMKEREEAIHLGKQGLGFDRSTTSAPSQWRSQRPRLSGTCWSPEKLHKGIGNV